jgi:hypothetical protein
VVKTLAAQLSFHPPQSIFSLQFSFSQQRQSAGFGAASMLQSNTPQHAAADEVGRSHSQCPVGLHAVGTV